MASDYRNGPDSTFDPDVLDRTVIALPLLLQMQGEPERDANLEDKRKKQAELEPKEKKRLAEIDAKEPEVYPVIIDLNLYHNLRTEDLKKHVIKLVQTVIKRIADSRNKIQETTTEYSSQYVFADLTKAAVLELARRTQKEEVPRRRSMKNVKDGLLGSTSPVHRSIHHIWPDFEVKAQLTKTISTVKADAAQKAFGAFGKGIVWAVMDSGIDVTHPHFNGHANVQLEPPFAHKSFCDGSAEEDPFGHGTHVAGIIAGVTTHGKLVLDGNGKMVGSTAPIVAISRRRTPDNGVQYDRATDIKEISGISPETKLISLKVLDEFGNGRASSIIAAIDYVQQINGYGREILIHGVNMSVGYDFEPEWFACGQSPLCVEVNRLVRSGVVVVVAAGNTGFGSIKSEARGVVSAGIGLTINDPGNADLAITVGSTHREMPHRYGVSYFSSKGPTGDGRLKPDLLAPGEKILSCAAGQKQVKAQSRLDDQEQGAKSKKVPDKVLFVEDSGTSMAAPHVSGVIAAFLSIRKEFIGQPEKVKEIFMETATDLHRERTFQGAGLIDLMRAIQSV